MVVKEELLSVAAVARRLGIAPATLRTWDRRYGLGPSSHEAGTHRRYCPLDVARLMLMRRLISSGVAPCEAAEQARVHKGKNIKPVIDLDFESRDDLVKALYKAAHNFDKAFIESELRKELAPYGTDSTWSNVVAPVLILVG